MLIKVKVTVGAKKDEVVRKSNDSFAVWVRAKAERGLANKSVAKILGVYLGLTISKVRLIRGVKRSNKIFEIP